MFHAIDYDHWDRKEIYETFNGCLYCLTVDVDVTRFLTSLHERGLKFYPSLCWCIAKTANSDRDFRFSKLNGAVGYWEQVNAHYTTRRLDAPHLFTHSVTRYTEDFSAFYAAFMQDKLNAEHGHSLYCYTEPQPDAVHISILPHTTQRALSYSKPNHFTNYDAPNTSYIPFVTVGKYFEQDGRMKLPTTVEFHHAVNDGIHAEKFFALLETVCDAF